MRHVKIKIFGERNSSTNALRRLLEQNTQSRVLPSVAPELDPHFAERMKSMAQRPQANLLQESYVDSIFRTAKPQFSWKHGATHFASLDDFRDCLVIFALRHPASWLLALHRRPYHALQPVPSRFEDFLQAPWNGQCHCLLRELR